jgi:hypothetical protein
MITPAEYHTLIYRHMSEKEWQQQVIDTAHTLGYTCYHNPDSRRSTAGYPDLALLRKPPYPPRYVLLELKKETGRVSKAQTQWIEGLKAAGIEVYVLRPHQYDELVEILKR